MGILVEGWGKHFLRRATLKTLLLPWGGIYYLYSVVKVE